MSIDTSSRVITRTTAALEAGIPYILHQGGTWSGKTFGILYSILFHMLKNFQPGDVATVAAETLPHLKKGAIKDFNNILSALQLTEHVTENKSDHRFILPNKSIVEFYAPDQEGKARSGKRKLLFINEANSMLYSIANQLIMRTDGSVILDWNPSGTYWLNKKLLPSLNEKEYIFTRTNYRDNKAVSEKIIIEIERLKLIDPVQYAIYGLGIEGKGTEIIYPNYELVDSFPPTERISTGLDFGYTNSSSAAVRCGMYQGCLYFEEIFYEKGLKNAQIAKLFELETRPYGPIIADQEDPKSIDDLKDLGLSIRNCVKGKDSIKYGIEQIKEYPIRIVKTSTNLIDEIDSYKWIMKDGIPTNEPKKVNDHLMDAMRYGIQGILTKHVPMNVRMQNAKAMGFTNIGI